MKVFIVTFDDPQIAQDYVENNHLAWPLLLDSDRSVYKKFGMGRASWWTLMKPGTIWKYFVLWLRGTKPQKIGSDVHQLGGDVLVDPSGRIRLLHVSKEPHDRPSVEAILSMVQKGHTRIS